MDGNPNSITTTTAPFWSAYGYTNDGFRKPEVAADGRLHGRPDSDDLARIASQKASNIVSPGYIQLSGTSFAAPIVSESRRRPSPATRVGARTRSRAR